MDANAWIAIAGLAVVIVAHLTGSAFVYGRLVERVAQLEKSAPDITALIRGLAGLEHAVAGNVKATDSLTKRFDESIGWLARVEKYPDPPATTTRTRRK